MDSTTQTQTEITTRAGVEAHAEDLYRNDRIADKLDGFDAVDAAALERFETQGFLAIENAFSPTEIRDAIDGLMDCIAGNRKGFQLNLEAGVDDFDKVKSLDEKLVRVRKLYKYCAVEPRLDAIATHPRLLDMLTRMMGEAPKMWADQALLKPPRIGTEKPWHQDNAYFNLPPATKVVGCWIALDEATPENGCMHVIPGSHRRGPQIHFRLRDWQICDRDVPIEEDVAVPLAPGGMLVFHGLLWHGTPSNRSEHTRRALQLHYYPASVQTIDAQDRLAVFGSEGKDVEC